MQQRKLTCGSLFSGIAGFDEGFRREGFETKWFVEREPFCHSVLTAHFPNVPIFNDVLTVGAHNLERVDCIAGGFPCQDLSVAGERAGLAGARSGLFFEFARVVAELKPKWFVCENVPGLFSSSEGRDFDLVIEAFSKLGYGVAWRTLDSQFFGVAQRRRRVFIVGCLGDGRSAAEILFESKGVCRDHPPSREKGQRVAPTISVRPSGGGGLGTDFDCDGGLVLNSRPSWCPSCMRRDGHYLDCPNLPDRLPTVAPCLTGNYGKQPDNSDTSAGPMLIAFSAGQSSKAGSIAAREEQAPTLRGGPSGTNQVPAIAIRTAQTSSNGWGIGTDEQAYTLDGAQGQAVAFQSSQSGVREVEAHATLDSNNGSRRHNGIIQGMAVRRLTPVECERLQSFPDNWTNVLHRGKPAADGPRYKALGNAVTVNVIQWIAKRIVAAENIV